MEINNFNIISGHARLDSEHAQIFVITDKLLDKNLSRDQRIAACESLLRYINEHCRYEESLMNEYQYPDKDAHFEDHRKLQDLFLNKLGSFIKIGGIASTDIREAFYSHILQIDMPFINFIMGVDNK